MTNAAIQTEQLTKFYGKNRGLDGLDLEVRSGEIFGFLGPNGAGKTTTIRLLLDLIRPTKGQVRVLGQDPRLGGPELRAKIGYLPGDLSIDGRQSVKELLTFLGQLRGGVGSAEIHDLAQRFSLDINRRIKALSKGNRQKVGIVQAFMHGPTLLILDEPTSGLDPLMQQEFLALVREARAAGQTVFMSSHVISEVQEVADRVGMIRDGRLVIVSDVDALRERDVRQLEIVFEKPPAAMEFQGLPGVRNVEVTGTTLRCTVDGTADALIKAAAQHTVLTLKSEELDLEEIFLTYYEKEDNRVGS